MRPRLSRKMEMFEPLSDVLIKVRGAASTADTAQTTGNGTD